jgi:hypothetical protein
MVEPSAADCLLIADLFGGMTEVGFNSQRRLLQTKLYKEIVEK